LGRRPWGTAASGSRGKRGRVTRGSRPPPRFGSEYGEAAAPRRLAGGGAVERGGGQEAGENGERDEGVRMPYLTWAGMERGGLATKVDGSGRRWPWWRRCKARGGASGGGRICGGGERDERPIYRRSKAVEEGRGGGGGRRARRGAINGARPLASVGGAIRGGDATSRAAGTRGWQAVELGVELCGLERRGDQGTG